MNIAIISYPYLTFYGGAERYVEEFAMVLERNGARVTIFSSKNLFSKTRKPKIKTVFVPNFPFIRRFKYYHEMFFCFLVYFIYKKKLKHFDLLFPQAVASYYLLRDRDLRKKIVTVSYDSPWRLYEKEEPIIYKQSLSVLCHTKACKMNILKNYRNLNENKFKVFYAGVDMHKFKKINNSEKKYIKEKYNIPSHRKFILTLQRMDGRKDMLTLCNVIINIARERPNFFIGIAGGGPDKNKVAEIINKASLSNIAMLGLIPEKDLTPLYSSAEIFISATWGQVVSEAMSCNTCTFILNDHPACKEYVCDNALLVEYSKDMHRQILNIADDEKKIKFYQQKGRMFVQKKFNWDDIAKNVLKFYMHI